MSMRSAARLSIPLLAWLVATNAASAASLSFTGTLSVRLAGDVVDQVLPPAPYDVTASISGSGVATVNGSGGGLHVSSLTLAGGEFAGSAGAPVDDAFPVFGLIFAASANPAATFTGLSGAPPTGGGIMPIPGLAKLCLFGECGTTYNVANLSVPLLPVGIGGYGSVKGPTNLTVIGAPWTTGSVSTGGLTGMGFARGPLSGTSSTAQASGAIRLVTPIYVSTNIPALSEIRGIATLTLHFVPEPGTLMLVASGIGALVLGGRRRAQR